jgi:DNA mismatch endonuclease, patch repair protein
VTDVFSKEKRSEIMSRIRGKNTTPELKVRSMLYRMGYRFRLHVADLPGKPDIVLPKYKTVIFVHGCFWHHHKGCPFAYMPRTKTEFWRSKLHGNVQRDSRDKAVLQGLGWAVEAVWECQTTYGEDLERLLRALDLRLHDRATRANAEVKPC